MQFIASVLTAITLILFGAANPAGAQDNQPGHERAGDFTVGDRDAPVLFITYASIACPHCGEFHRNAHDLLMQKAQAGEVRYIYRELIAGPQELALAGAMLARCAGEERYLDVVDALFEHQESMFTAMREGTAQSRLSEIIALVGMSEAEFEACRSGERALSLLEKIRGAHEQAIADGIRRTPSFFANGAPLTMGPARGTRGHVYLLDGAPLSDDAGLIPANFEADTIERLLSAVMRDTEG